MNRTRTTTDRSGRLVYRATPETTNLRVTNVIYRIYWATCMLSAPWLLLSLLTTDGGILVSTSWGNFVIRCLGISGLIMLAGRAFRYVFIDK